MQEHPNVVNTIAESLNKHFIIVLVAELIMPNGTHLKTSSTANAIMIVMSC